MLQPSPIVPLNGAAQPPAPTLYDAIGRPIAPRDDPGWQPPRDPLDAVDVQERIRAISREIPIVVVATGWDVPMARRAIDDLVIGLFDRPAQMWDAIVRSDSRVQSGLASRLSILGRPVDFRLPRKYRDSDAAKECHDAFVDAWPEMATEAVMGEMQRWAIGMGLGPSQILWDMTGDYAIPKPLPWHMRYTYYDWMRRCLVAISLDGQEPIVAGDGHWMMHAPNGEYRGWMRGAVGAITPWWLARHYALRDAARWSERNGLGLIKAKAPAVGDPVQGNAFRASLTRMGSETVIYLPQNPPPALSYDVELMESNGIGFDGFFRLIDQCNQEITLALLAQTLTTSMPAEGGSSYAAARVHAGVLQGLMEADARALARTVYRDLARPFAAVNFGNPDLAPRVVWDVTPFEDAKTKALAFMQLAEALNFMRVAGYKLDRKEVRKLIRDTIAGFDVGSIEEVDPLAIQAVGAKAKADQKAATAQAKQDTGAHAVRLADAGARFDPRILERVRVGLAEESESEAVREAIAAIEAEHSPREQSRRSRWTW